MLRLILYVFCVYLLVVPTIVIANVKCDQILEPLPKSAISAVSPAIIKKLQGVEAHPNKYEGGAFIKISKVVEHSAEEFGIQIERGGRVMGFYGAVSIPDFASEHPEVAQKFGFKLFEYTKTANNSGAAFYEVPDVTTLNKNIKALRKSGVLPDNGLELIFVTGEIKDLDYIKLIRMGKIPVGLDNSFFHDINVHMLGFLFMPKEVFQLYQKNISLVEKIIDDDDTMNYIKNSADYIELESMFGKISRSLDTMTAYSAEGAYYPQLYKMRDDINHLVELKKLLGKSPYSHVVDELIQEFNGVFEKFGSDRGYGKWIDGEKKRMKVLN